MRKALFLSTHGRQKWTPGRELKNKKHDSAEVVRPLFFLFLAYSGLVYAADRKKRKQNTLSTRGCGFWVPLNTRGDLTRAPHGKKHTLNTRGCSFEYH